LLRDIAPPGREDDVEVFNNPFDDPPEAAAEAEPGATIYIRVPASLKKRVDEAAREVELSGNVWAMRCVEQCLDRRDELDTVADIWNVAATFRAHDDWKFKHETAREAFSEICDLCERLCKHISGGK
jgi:predicted transcriptional regulator